MVSADDRINDVIYYSSFAGYSIPLKPIKKITKNEAESRKTYCVGYYNVDGILIRFEKYLNGAIFFKHEYCYHENGKIKESRVVNVDGVLRINKFDKNGALISNGH